MHLTDDELAAIQYEVYDQVYYGDDDIVYGDGAHAVALRSGLEKLNAELRRRGI